MLVHAGVIELGLSLASFLGSLKIFSVVMIRPSGLKQNPKLIEGMKMRSYAADESWRMIRGLCLFMFPSPIWRLFCDCFFPAAFLWRSLMNDSPQSCGKRGPDLDRDDGNSVSV